MPGTRVSTSASIWKTTSGADRAAPNAAVVRTAFPICSFGLAALTVAAFVAAPLPELPLAADAFWQGVLDRQRPSEPWRTVTAHLLHTDLNHLFWNLLALVVLAWTIERRSRLLLMLSLLVGMVAVGVWFFSLTDAPYYCGFSGVLNALLVVALYTLYLPHDLRGLAAPRRHVYNGILVLVAVGALVKNLYELATGAALVSNTAWDSAPGAHLAGWVAGLGVVLAACWRSRPEGR